LLRLIREQVVEPAPALARVHLAQRGHQGGLLLAFVTTQLLNTTRKACKA
jgi:hypothetical protein